MPKVLNRCEQCGVAFETYPSQRRRFCSLACFAESQASVEKECKRCGKRFYVWPSHAARRRYCSRRCAIKARIGIRTALRVIRVCEWCGEEFEVKQSIVDVGKGKYCSKKCSALAYPEKMRGAKSPRWTGGNVQRTCAMCGKKFEAAQYAVARGQGHFCSLACSHRYFVGERSYHWRGGREPYPQEFSIPFRRSVHERDDYECALCHHRPSKVVHHIDYDKQHTVMENCITLCPPCHGRTNSHRRFYQTILQAEVRRRER